MQATVTRTSEALPTPFGPASIQPCAPVPPPELRQAFVTPADFGLGDRGLARTGGQPRTPVPTPLRSIKLPGSSHIAMTTLEAAGLLCLLCDPSLVRVVPAAHVLAYPDGDGWGHFVPDAAAVRRDRGVSAFAFRYSWDRTDQAKATERKLRRAYDRVGISLVVLTELTLFSGAVRENRAAMLRDHVAEGQRGDVDRVRAALDRLGFPATVEDVRRRSRFAADRGIGRTLRCLHELALAGEVRLDLDRRFDGATRIRRGPCA